MRMVRQLILLLKDLDYYNRCHLHLKMEVCHLPLKTAASHHHQAACHPDPCHSHLIMELSLPLKRKTTK
jgi:hypothetical protein